MTEQATFPYLRFRLHIRAVRCPAHAVPNAERVRAAFGRELVWHFCPFGAPRCQDDAPAGTCPQLTMCPYAQVFARFDARGHCARPPFALFTGSTARGSFVELTLFGKAWPFFLWAVQALERGLLKGIGGPARDWRVLSIHRVHADGRCSRLNIGKGMPTPDLLPDNLPVGPETGDADRARDRSPVAVELLSPARVIEARRVLGDGDPLTFGTLVRRAMDRLLDLYGEDAHAALTHRIGNRDPDSVPLLADHTRFVSLRCRSGKKRKTRAIGGKQGTLVYGAGAAAFLPLLRCAAITHVGKSPVYGLGRIRARILDCAVKPYPSRPSSSHRGETNVRSGHHLDTGDMEQSVPPR